MMTFFPNKIGLLEVVKLFPQAFWGGGGGVYVCVVCVGGKTSRVLFDQSITDYSERCVTNLASYPGPKYTLSAHVQKEQWPFPKIW